jgi:hypothetical protein
MFDERCGNCAYFVPEPNVRIPFRLKSELENSGVPVVYGRCQAIYVDKDNHTVKFNRSTLSSSRCLVADDSGNKLFASGIRIGKEVIFLDTPKKQLPGA